MNKDQMQQGTDGSGSAEQTGRERSEQQFKHTDKQKVSADIGESRDRIADPGELGAFSGRDDSSGGSGDGMENENSGSSTDR
jgi:hypothetical protein